jgi:hypothetical protein
VSGISHGSDGPGGVPWTFVPGHALARMPLWPGDVGGSLMEVGDDSRSAPRSGSKQGRPGGARIRGFFMPEYKNIKATRIHNSIHPIRGYRLTICGHPCGRFRPVTHSSGVTPIPGLKPALTIPTVGPGHPFGDPFILLM